MRGRLLQWKGKKIEFHRRRDVARHVAADASASEDSNLLTLGKFEKALKKKGVSIPPMLIKWLAFASKSGKLNDEEAAESIRLQLQQIACSGDFIVKMLCAHFRVQVARLQEVDLESNSLSDSAVESLTNTVSEALLLLNLRSNNLGQASCKSIVRYLQTQHSERNRLQSLDLSHNPLGDTGVQKLVSCLSSGLVPDLTELGLAETQIGRDHSTGVALRELLADHRKLVTLDIHFNFLAGVGGYELLYGVYENAENGKLRCLDVSWNLFAVSESWRIAQVLATVLRDCDKLVHLDLSYNHLQTEDMCVIADALQRNTTLWGIHLVGNAATVDAEGFVTPVNEWLPPCTGHRRFTKNQRKQTELPAKVETTVSGTRIWQGSGNAANLPPEIFSAPWDREQLTKNDVVCGGLSGLQPATMAVEPGQPLGIKDKLQWLTGVCAGIPTQFRKPFQKSGGGAKGTSRVSALTPAAGCCWICESWVEVELRWVPGLSGPATQDEVKSVRTFLSVDNFVHPVTLEWHSETQAWSGFKMLPPTNVPILIIFQVNDQLEVAQNLPVYNLVKPVSIMIDLKNPKDQAEGFKPTHEISEVNILVLSEWATTKRGEDQRFGQLLTVTDDLEGQRKMVVTPRNVKRP